MYKKNLVHVHGHQVWLHDRLHRAVSVDIGGGVKSSGVHSMDCLSVIQNIYITSLKTSPENTYNFTSASNFDDT